LHFHSFARPYDRQHNIVSDPNSKTVRVLKIVLDAISKAVTAHMMSLEISWRRIAVHRPCGRVEVSNVATSAGIQGVHTSDMTAYRMNCREGVPTSNMKAYGDAPRE
jgi:hypothetical protein